MARLVEQAIVIADLTGGRNDTDPPLSLAANQAVEMLNVDWKDTTFARKRGGSIAVAQTGGTAFGSGIQSMLRHVPGAAETGAELWATDGAGTPLTKRLTGGTTWADVSFDDAIASRPQDVVGASLNGKLFLAFDSTQDRLHVYDPSLASARVRRVGFATPGAPSVADTGSGSYAAVLRYYRVRWIQVSGSTLVRRSEAGASQSFTPSGSGTGAVVTRPTAAGEGETHWEVDWSADNATWYKFNSFDAGTHVAIATTTSTDNDTAATNSGRGASDPAGMYARFPSVKYLIADGNRLLGAHAWEASGANSGGKTARVWFTPVLGSADKGDDERLVSQSNLKTFVDLNENDGGGITGLAQINGTVYAFKYRQVYRLGPTGDVNAPYLPKRLRADIGCIAHKTICEGEDQHGNPALYFLSHRGPYRIVQIEGVSIVQFLGRQNQVMWRSMNLGASTVVAHAVYYPDLHQVWFWIATGSSDDPDTKMVFDVHLGFPDQNGQIVGGWVKHDGPSANARCSCMFSNTLGASMSRDLKPHLGRSVGTTIYKTDTSDLDDNSTDFQAYVKTRPIITLGELGRKVGLEEPYLLAKALTGVTITLTSDRDFGIETRTHTQVLTAAGSETRVFKKFEGAGVGEADVIQVQIGDGAAQDGAWSFDALKVPYALQERR